jgi:hypothetical protein
MIKCKHKHIKGFLAVCATGGLCDELCPKCKIGFLDNGLTIDLNSLHSEDGKTISANINEKLECNFSGFYVSVGESEDD